MSGQSWRPETDAEDYFIHQKKQLTLADRRPVIRKASDLVGPGFGANTIRITDYNSVLATFNGYFSSAPGADNAPNGDEAFTGYVVSDAELGGQQVFTGLSSGTEYRRTFTRSVTDSATLGWGAWSGSRIPATATSGGQIPTTVPGTSSMVLTPPTMLITGEPGVFERSDAGITVLKQGVYTGAARFTNSGTYTPTATEEIFFYYPKGGTTVLAAQYLVVGQRTLNIPFTVTVSDTGGGFTLTYNNTSVNPIVARWDFSCTRVGDAY